MKKGFIFVLGLISGCFLSFVFCLFSVQYPEDDSKNIILAEQQLPFTAASRFKVIQVLPKGVFAVGGSGLPRLLFTGPVVYIPSDGQNQFYNDQIIEVPSEKEVVQIGTYRYRTRLEEKVVPVLKFI